MTEPLRSRLIVAGGGLVLFFAVGIRQGFGLFLVPVTDAGLSREAFSLAVALQYLVWGIVSPLAAGAARFLGHERLLALGGIIYAGGFVMASALSGRAELSTTTKGFSSALSWRITCSSAAT